METATSKSVIFCFMCWSVCHPMTFAKYSLCENPGKFLAGDKFVKLCHSCDKEAVLGRFSIKSFDLLLNVCKPLAMCITSCFMFMWQAWHSLSLQSRKKEKIIPHIKEEQKYKQNDANINLMANENWIVNGLYLIVKKYMMLDVYHDCKWFSGEGEGAY